MKKTFLAATAALLLLAGCAGVGAWVGQSVENAKAAKDLEAGVLLVGQCAAGRGATNRMFKDQPAKLAALDLLCDGPDPGRQAPTLDAHTLDVIRALFQMQPPAAPD
jgi:cytochrome bd-type quinol oxidase subunit 1